MSIFTKNNKILNESDLNQLTFSNNKISKDINLKNQKLLKEQNDIKQPIENTVKENSELTKESFENIITNGINKLNSNLIINPDNEIKTETILQLKTDDNKKINLLTEEINTENVIQKANLFVEAINRTRKEKEKITIEEFTEIIRGLFKKNQNLDLTINTNDFKKDVLTLITNLLSSEVKQNTSIDDIFSINQKQNLQGIEVSEKFVKENTTLKEQSIVNEKQNLISEIDIKSENKKNLELEDELLSTDVKNTLTTDDNKGVFDQSLLSKQKLTINNSEQLIEKNNKNEISISDTSNEIKKVIKKNELSINNTFDIKTKLNNINNEDLHSSYNEAFKKVDLATQDTISGMILLFKTVVPFLSSRLPIGLKHVLENSIDGIFDKTGALKDIMNDPVALAQTLSPINLESPTPSDVGNLVAFSATSVVDDINIYFDYTDLFNLLALNHMTIHNFKGFNIKTVYKNPLTGLVSLPPTLRNNSNIQADFKFTRDAITLGKNSNISTEFKNSQNIIKTERNKFMDSGNFGFGSLLVRFPTPINNANLTFEWFRIPFQFMPKTSTQSIKTSFAQEKILNRIGQIFTFTGTESMKITIDTEFLALSDSDKRNDFPDNLSSFYLFWSQQKVDLFMNKFKSLSFPLYEKGTQKFLPPPLLCVDFGDTSNILKNISFTKEQRKVFIVDSVDIDQNLEKYPIHYNDSSKDIFLHGFGLKLSLIEVNENIFDIPPSFGDYFGNISNQQLKGEVIK